MDGKAIGVFDSEVVEFLSEENVVDVYVGVDEGELCLIGSVLECSSDDLEHGGYAGAAGNHANVA